MPEAKKEPSDEQRSVLNPRDVMVITRAYNRVRFGGQKLSAIERKEVERALFALEGNTDKHG